VGPSGAISASAGSFVLLAGHIAAMSPSTSVGAATPVQVGVTGISPVENKTVNYMASYIRSIAESRGRPPDIAEKFVTEALSLTAREAMEAGVIDFMADSVEDLLKEINGMEINVKGRPVMVDTSEYELIRYEKGLTEEIMNVLANPQVAAILLLIGIYGLIFGLSSPGTYIPETIGIIALVLALYGLGTFEVNVLGIILIILGVILSIAELVTPTYGGLTVAAAVSFILGALLLPKEPMLSSSFYREFAIAVGGAVVVLVIFFTVAFTAILRIRKRKKAVGGEELIGLQGEVVEVYDGKALIRIRGEIWRAEVEEKLEKGDKVVVVDRDGLILLVKKVNNGLV
jgi:membrane-bound serine protease (ClpP class)